jgi:hypothetical protein
MIDLISTLIMEAEEKIAASEDCLSIQNGLMGSIMPMLHKYILQKHYYCNRRAMQYTTWHIKRF